MEDMSLIYLPSSFSIDQAIESIMTDKDLQNVGLTPDKVKETIYSFEGNLLAATVFLKKYPLRDKDNKILEFTFSEAKDRWALAISSADTKPPEYYRSLYDYFLPGGRQMLMLGNPLIKGTASNCFTHQIREDSLEGIFEAGFTLAKTFSYGGGQGIDIGVLRPKGAEVSNTAKYSTGAVSFMELFSTITRIIGQKGRRGALMISIPVNHPDIEDFIEIKHTTNKVEEANISIKITDEFMEAVEKDQLFTLSFRTKHEEVSRQVNARNLFRRICQAARDKGDPGLLFWDTAKEYSPSELYKPLQIAGVNPCQPSIAPVLTPSGIRPLGEVGIGDIVWSGKKWTTIIQKKSSGWQNVYLYHTRTGSFLGTKEHKIVSSGKKIQVQHANTITQNTGPFLVENRHEKPLPQDVMDGLVFGDGSVHKASGNLVYLIIGKNDQDYFSSEISNLIVKHRPGLKPGSYEIKTTILASELPYTYQREVPSRFLYGNSLKVRGFLRGLYSANGSIVDKRVTLKTSSFLAVQMVQQMLSSIGIGSYYTINPKHTVKFSNGEYVCKKSYDLNISTDRRKFQSLVGFIQKYKNIKLDTVCKIPTKKIKEEYDIHKNETVSLGEMEVFDITVAAEEHTYWTGGLLVSNCAEILLDSEGACCLGSLLLHKFVLNPFTPQATFDYILMANTIHRAVRHLDTVITLSKGKYPLQAQEDKAFLGRRIGLGFTGLADTLAALGIRYDALEANETIDKITGIKAYSEYQASIELAKEKGMFPLCKPEEHYEQPFTSMLPEHVKEEGRKYGQRNVSISTVAPSGSISLLAHCSSGIEPHYDLQYKRAVLLGKERMEYDVKEYGVVRYLQVHPEGNPEELFIPAHKIDWKKRIELQSVIQLHTDSAISSTINLPKETTTDLVQEIYMKAWNRGLKGITVYVDGSKKGILSSGTDIDGDSLCYRFRAEGGDKFYVNISYRNKQKDKPYQIFITNYKATEYDRFVKITNELKKLLLDKGISSLKEGETVEHKLEQQTGRSKNTLEKMTRFMSLAFKSGYLDETIEILSKHSFVGTLAARLKEILSYKEVAHTCPKCGEKLTAKQGCFSCLSCGYEKCEG